MTWSRSRKLGVAGAEGVEGQRTNGCPGRRMRNLDLTTLCNMNARMLLSKLNRTSWLMYSSRFMKRFVLAPRQERSLPFRQPYKHQVPSLKFL
jgi:hypothetical protein